MKIALIVTSSNDLPDVIKNQKYFLECDIFLSVFNKPLENTIENVKDIVYVGTTWGQSRNFMYKYIKKKYGDIYDYFIFTDDDIIIKNINDQSVLPIKKFKSFLEEYEPAVACLKYDWQYTEKDKPVNTLCNMDHCFVAYHKICIKNIFPYYCYYDSESEFYNGHIMNSLTTVMFNKYKLQYNSMNSINSCRESHKNEERDWNKPYNFILQELKPDAHKYIINKVNKNSSEPNFYETSKKNIDYNSLTLSSVVNDSSKLLYTHNVYNNLENKKIAVLISGEIRCFDKFYDNFIKYIYNNRTIFQAFDIYCVSTTINENLKSLCKKYEVTTDKKHSTVLNNNALKTGIDNYIYQISDYQKVWKLMESSNINYDHVIRMRPDIKHFYNPILFSEFHDDMIEVPKFHYWDGVNDRFAIGDYKSMNIYMNIYDDIDMLMSKYPNKKAEAILKNHLDDKNIKFTFNKYFNFKRITDVDPDQKWNI